MIYDKIKDYWGRPIATFSGSRHPLDKVHCQFLADRAEEVLKEAGAIKVWKKGGGTGLCHLS